MIGGKEIIKQVDLGNITIEPFNQKQAGPNSYDLRLSDQMARVVSNSNNTIITTKGSEVETVHSKNGYFILEPNQLYLGCTVETVGSDYYIAVLHGRSTAARHGLMIHFAGLCDLGWKGQITLEMVNMTPYPMLVPPGIRLCQVSFEYAHGEYELYSSTYQGQKGPTPAKALCDIFNF